MPAIRYFFILNERGSPILIRAFLTEPNIEVVEYFYARVTSANPPPPIFRFEDKNYAFTVFSKLYFVLVTLESMSPALLQDLLNKLTLLLTDYLGTCTEIKIQKNLALCYEIIDEAMSFGCPQATDSSHLLHLVHNTVDWNPNIIIEKIETELDPGKSFNRPLAVEVQQRTKQINESFLVVTEVLSLELSMHNKVLSASVAGAGRMKSFLVGNPQITMMFDPQVTVKTRPIPKDLLIKLDDIVFASNVVSRSFDTDRSIHFSPPDGLSDVFNYRSTQVIAAPFQLMCDFETKTAKVAVVRVTIRSTFGVDLCARDFECIFQAPVEISNATCEVYAAHQDTQMSVFNRKKRTIVWKIEKFPGLQEFSARFRFIFDDGLLTSPEVILGPILLKFSILNYLPSGVKFNDFLLSSNTSTGNPQKWFKRECISGSYIYNLA